MMKVEFKIDYRIAEDDRLHSATIIVEDSDEVMDMVNDAIGKFNEYVWEEQIKNPVVCGIICEGYVEEE